MISSYSNSLVGYSKGCNCNGYDICDNSNTNDGNASVFNNSNYSENYDTNGNDENIHKNVNNNLSTASGSIKKHFEIVSIILSFSYCAVPHI